MSGILIRPESATDVDAIRDVEVEAFRDHPVSRQTEHLIVDALRDAGAMSLSLVALSRGRVVGHIAFSEAAVGKLGAGWFLLGPIGVLPECQSQGTGSALIEAGLAELRSRGARGCVLVGDPSFYGRFGFSTYPGLTYEGVPDQYVLGLPFGNVMPAGEIRAHDAFLLDAE